MINNKNNNDDLRKDLEETKKELEKLKKAQRRKEIEETFTSSDQAHIKKAVIYFILGLMFAAIIVIAVTVGFSF